MPLEFHPGNDTVLSVTGLNRGGVTITDAAVTYTLRGPTGATLAAGALPHVGSGTYSATVESTVTDLMAVGARHTCTLVVAGGAYDARSVEVFFPAERSAA